MTDQPYTPPDCEHHWIHYGQPSHSPIRWIVKCSQCNQFNIPDLQEQVRIIEAAAEQRGAEKALRELAKDAVLVPAAPDKAAKFYRDRADRIADQMEDDDG